MLKPARFLVALPLMLLVAIAPASVLAQDPVTLTFRSTIDTTPIGGQPDDPLIVTYTFAPDLAPGTGPFGSTPSADSYGPIEVHIQVGSEQITISGPGTGITVFNDAGTSIVEDSYDVRADWPSALGRQLFGRNLILFRFLLVDPDRTMFASTALPVTHQFAADADYAVVDVMLQDDLGDTVYLSAFGQPFTLAAPARTCSSSVTTVDELREAVESLTTAGGTKRALLNSLSGAQAALVAGDAEQARLHLRTLINKLVNRSNLDPADPHSIPLGQANALICAGANVLVGVQLE